MTADPTPRRPVLVGVDDSTSSRPALAFAAEEARYRGTELVVLTAFDPPDPTWLVAYGAPPLHYDGHTLEALTRARAAAQQMVDDVLGAGAPDVRVHAVTGPAAAALVDASTQADLLVVGTRGRGGFRELLLGSVSLQCVLHACCPVTVVRPTTRTVEAAAAVRAPAVAPAPAVSS